MSIEMIETQEGRISRKKLDALIEKARATYDIKYSVSQIRNWVILDFDEDDISQVTVYDIVETVDGLGIEYPVEVD